MGSYVTPDEITAGSTDESTDGDSLGAFLSGRLDALDLDAVEEVRRVRRRERE